MRSEYRYVALCGLILLSLSSCRDKICPAFQSFYVLDERQRDLMFSPFGEDTLPRVDYNVRKSSFGVVSQSPVLPYLQKLEEFKMVERELLFARESTLDSVGSADEQIDVREELGEVSDTTAREQQDTGKPDSQADYKIKENRNVEQATYDRLFGEYLKAAEEGQGSKKKKEKTEKEDKKGPPPQAEPEQVGDGQVEQERIEEQVAAAKPKKKKGLLGGFGKKKKRKEAGSEEKEEEP